MAERPMGTDVSSEPVGLELGGRHWQLTLGHRAIKALEQKFGSYEATVFQLRQIRQAGRARTDIVEYVIWAALLGHGHDLVKAGELAAAPTLQDVEGWLEDLSRANSERYTAILVAVITTVAEALAPEKNS